MHSGIEDVACDLSNSESLGTTALLCTAEKKNNVEAEHNDQRLRVKQRTGPRRVQLWTVTDVFVEWMALIIVTLEALVHISQLSFAESDASRDGCSPLLWFRGQLNKNNKICGSRNRTAKLNGHTRTLLKKAPTEFGNIFIGVCGLTALLFRPINVCVNKVVAPVVNWKWKQVTEPFYWLNSLYSPLELQRSSIHCRTVRPCTWLRCQERLFFFFLFDTAVAHGLGFAHSFAGYFEGCSLVGGDALSIGPQIWLHLLPHLLLGIQLFVWLTWNA